MEKAYIEIDWEDRPSTATPLAEQNLDAMSRGLSTVDDRVIDLYNAQQDSPKSITVDENTGLITIIKHDGSSYTYNPSTKIYNTISANEQATRSSFEQVSRNFGDVHDLLDAMDLKVDINAETANAGLTNLQTIITQNDGYYRQEMSGISTNLGNVQSGLNDRIDATNNDIAVFKSSITQTTQAIQLSVSSVSGSVSDLSDSLDANVSRLEAQIDVTAGAIAMKVSKYEVIDDLQLEFGSGIEITPDDITIASTGALIINTSKFKLDKDGNVRIDGHVDMASGSIDGEPLVTAKDDGNGLHVNHSNSAWKLRSAQIDDLGTRYYTYMTKNKNLIVSDSRTGGHNADNDRTDECSIGTKNYPWRKGYFKKLFIQETTQSGKSKTYNVIPEAIEIELDPSYWRSYNGYFVQEVVAHDMGGNVYLYVASSSATDLNLLYTYDIDVDAVNSTTIMFVARTQPSESIHLILLAEEYTMARMDPAELSISFEKAFNQLSCWWDSPDGGRFISWDSDELVIERYDDTLGDWVEEVVFPLEGEDPFGESQFADNPLIVGSEVN